MAHAYQQLSRISNHIYPSNSPIPPTLPNILDSPNHQGQVPSVMSSQYYRHPLQPPVSKPPSMYIPPPEATPSTGPAPRPSSKSSQQYIPSHVPDPVRTGESAAFLQSRLQSSFHMTALQGQSSHIRGISTEMDSDMDLSMLFPDQYQDAGPDLSPKGMRNQASTNAMSPSEGKGGKGAGRKKRGIDDESEGKFNARAASSGKRGNIQDNAKQRGRPRLETKDETAADRRRTQIREAQRAYRLRKETTITSLKDRVSELESTIEGMQTAFLELHDATNTALNEKSKPSADVMHHLSTVLRSATERFLSLAKTARARGTSAGHGSSDDEDNGDLSKDENASNNHGPKRSKLSTPVATSADASDARTGEGAPKDNGTAAETELSEPSFGSYAPVGATTGGSSIVPGIAEQSRTFIAKPTTVSTNFSVPREPSLTGEGAAYTMSNAMPGFEQPFAFEGLLHPVQNNVKDNMMLEPFNVDLNNNDSNGFTCIKSANKLKRKYEDDTDDTYDYSLTTYHRPYSPFKVHVADSVSVLSQGDWSLAEPFFPSLSNKASPCPYRELSLSPIPDPLIPLPHPHVQPFPKKDGFRFLNVELLTYNLFDRDSFAAKLHRCCIERGYVLLTSLDVDKKELARVFAFTFCYVTKEQATRAIGAMVQQMDKRKSREKLGQKKVKSSGRMIENGSYFDEGEQNSWPWGGNRYALLTGFDVDEYMRPEEVEQYCIERGVFSGPTGNGHYVYPSNSDSYGWSSTESSDSGINMRLSNSPSPRTSSEQMEQTTGGGGCLDLGQQQREAEAYFSCCGASSAASGGSDCGYSTSPVIPQQIARKPFKSTINIDKFIEELLCVGICLGNSPGFKRIDVEKAIRLSLLPGANLSPPAPPASSAFFMPSPMSIISDGTDVGPGHDGYGVGTSAADTVIMM